MSTNSDENPPPPAEEKQQEEAGGATKSPSTSPSKPKPKFQLGGFMEEVKKAKEDAQQRMKQGTEKFQSNMKQSTEKLQSKFAAAARKESASPSSSPADLVPEEKAAEKESDVEEQKKHHHVTLNPKKMAQSVAHGIEKTVEKTKDVVTIHKKDKAKSSEQQQKQSSRAAEEEPLIDSSAGASMKSAPAVADVKDDEPAPSNKKVFPALNMPSTRSSEKIEPLDDEKVVAIIVASFLVSTLLNHWREMVANQMPASVVFTFSLASFYAGQYIEPEFWKHAFQEYILCGPEEETVTTAGEDQTELHTTARDLSAASIAEQQQKKKMPIFFRGLTKKKSPTTKKPFSALSRSTKIPIHTNSKLLAKLLTNPMFRSKGVDGAGSEEGHMAATTSEDKAGGAATARPTTSRMGSTDTSEMQNPKTGSVNTLCEFRGMDVFLTEDAEERMGDHPFLIE